MASLDETFAQRKNESTSQINNLYDKQYNTQAASLKTDYDKNMSDKQAALGQIMPQYQAQANSVARNYEQNRRNANLQSMASGLGTGTQQQQQLALQNQYMNNYSGVRAQEANAVNSANQGMADLTTAYNNALVNARNEADTKRDAAIIENSNKLQNWYDTQAGNLAQYGDFSGYKNMYGDAQANNMRNTWIAQNPDVAFRSGMISKDDYKKITGRDPEYQSIYG